MTVQTFATQTLRWLDRRSPRLASRMAEQLFSTPPPTRLSVRAKAFLLTGTRRWLWLNGGRVATWTWGQEGPLVAVLHGWGGRASQFAALVPMLVSAGCRVVAVDAPGHGFSAGASSSLAQFVACLRAVSDAYGPLHAVVGHSMGGAAIALAIRQGLPVDAAVFIASPADPSRYSRSFATRLGLGDRTLDLMRTRMANRLGMPWEELAVSRGAEQLKGPLLVIHDRDDDDVAYDNALTFATHWPGARLMTTHGLGHRRILWAPSVVREVARFVAPHEPVTCRNCGRLVRPTTTWCLNCRLEQELYDPCHRLGA